MTIKERLKQIIGDFTSLIYPNLCVCCGKCLHGDKEIICFRCIEEMPLTNLHIEEESKISERFFGKADVEMVAAYFYYTKGSKYQKLIHHLKYKGRKDIGVILGKAAGLQLIENHKFRNLDMIVPVPLHKNRLRKRGYNQSQSIAEGLSQAMGIPVACNNMQRVIENTTQTNKSVFERSENTLGIFQVQDGTLFDHKHILLVDDVLTTGSTLIACIESIKRKSNAKVSIFTLAVA